MIGYPGSRSMCLPGQKQLLIGVINIGMLSINGRQVGITLSIRLIGMDIEQRLPSLNMVIIRLSNVGLNSSSVLSHHKALV